MSEPHYGEDRLERLLRRALGAPVATDPAAKRRIMELVRAEAARGAPQPSGVVSLSSRRGWTTPAVGGLLAAALAGLMVLGPARLGGGAGGGVAGAIADSTVVSTLRDTLRLVQFVLVAPAASRVSLVGEFNGWRRDETQLASDDSGRWRGSVRLAPGTHRYAFVVDDTQWVADPAAARDATATGRPVSVRVVGGE